MHSKNGYSSLLVVCFFFSTFSALNNNIRYYGYSTLYFKSGTSSLFEGIFEWNSSFKHSIVGGERDAKRKTHCILCLEYMHSKNGYSSFAALC